jgi:hypothetical protein
MQPVFLDEGLVQFAGRQSRIPDANPAVQKQVIGTGLVQILAAALLGGALVDAVGGVPETNVEVIPLEQVGHHETIVWNVVLVALPVDETNSILVRLAGTAGKRGFWAIGRRLGVLRVDGGGGAIGDVLGRPEEPGRVAWHPTSVVAFGAGPFGRLLIDGLLILQRQGLRLDHQVHDRHVLVLSLMVEGALEVRVLLRNLLEDVPVIGRGRQLEWKVSNCEQEYAERSQVEREEITERNQPGKLREGERREEKNKKTKSLHR